MSTNKYLIDLYTSHYKNYGVNAKGLGWGSKDRTALRYEILSSRWPLEHATILDVGCGFGDSYNFFTQKNIKNLQYIGIDINPTFISIARKRYPEATFLECDPTTDKNLGNFDYVFASGIFNDHIPNAKQRITRIVKAIRSHTKRGFAINFLSNKVDYQLPHAHHTDPAWALNLCYTFSNNVILRNDYIPFEFTISVDCYEPFDKTQVIYKRFL